MSSEFDRQGLVDIFVTEASEALDVLTKAFHPSDGTRQLHHNCKSSTYGRIRSEGRPRSTATRG